jgi:hypothetical protein
LETFIVAKISDCGGDRIQVMGEAEVARVKQDDFTRVAGPAERNDRFAVRPIVGNVDT